VTAKSAYTPLVATFSHGVPIVSRAAAEREGDDGFARRPMGPGPYRFVRQVRGDRMELEAFDRYWAGKPKIRRIIVRYVPDISSRVAALEAGEVDVIHAFTPFDAERIKNDPNLVFINAPSAAVVRFNMNTQRQPFNDLLVRRAMAYGIDRAAIVKEIFRGSTRIAHSLTPDNSFGYLDTYDVYRYDPDKARQLLREAGVPSLTFTFSFGSGRYLMDKEVAEAVQAQLAKIGVTMRINQMEWGQFQAMIRQPLDRSPSQMTYTWWRTPNGDADPALGVFATNDLPPRGNNVTFYSTPEFDRLFEAQQAESDVHKRRALLRQAQQLLMNELPAVPMYHEPIFWATRKTVSGFAKRVTGLSTVNSLYDVELK
jgi:peptide/nickel transport system substrate-binding protein